MYHLYLLLIAFMLFSCSDKNKVFLYSPDKKTKLNFKIDESSQTVYSIEYNDSVIVKKSTLGFQLEGDVISEKNLEIAEFSKTSFNNTWKPVYGERAEINNRYNQLQIYLKEKSSAGNTLKLTFRLYNEGVALNYTFLPQQGLDSIHIQKEITEFALNENYESWISNRAQSEYRKERINAVRDPAERPLVIETRKLFLAIGEACLVDFPRMKIVSGKKENTLTASLEGSATVALPYTTPWRTIMIGESPAELLQNNDFYLNLNPPCAIEDVSWIKPGKVIREVTLTTRGGLACVDFAAENGLQYVEFDAGWYGSEYEESSDATTITVDPKRSPGPLDLQRIIDYAESKGIGIILYVNRRALEKQLDIILPLYQSWGIKGVKYGFVRVGSQEWTRWLHEAVKKAAAHKLMVDIHDEYRPTGFSRTYPNLMTQEGIRGDEESPSNKHTLITLFTRMLAGAGDNTICYYAPRVTEKMGGHVSQLAKAVMLYSPWQFLYWYDRPQGSPGKKGGAGSSEGFIQNHPELQFFKHMPTVWNETKVLEGKIGEYATIARKSGKDWYLGSLTGNKSKSVEINFDFLKKDTQYEATIYSYDPDIDSSTKVKIESKPVNNKSVLTIAIKANSGLAIHIQPI